jgi:branched-chain amino acid transport system permease protein
MAYLRTHTLVRHLAFLLLAAALLLLLTYALSPYRNYQLATAAAYLCATAGLTVLVGLSGQLSLGHGALMAVGAYSYALLAPQLIDGGVPGQLAMIVGLLGAIAATMAFGGLLGVAGARLAGPYLAGLTLTVVIVVPALTTTFASTLGGDQGLSVPVDPAPGALGSDFPFERWQAWIALAAALLTMLVLANVVKGRPGRQMRAVRDDEVAARLAGINVGRTKVAAFVLSSATAGLGGGLLAVLTQSVSPGAFSLAFSLFLLMAVVVGGLGHLSGAVWGAVLLVVLPDLADQLAESLPVSSELAERLDGNLSIGIFGLLLVAVMIAFPAGIDGLLRGLARRLPWRRPPAAPGRPTPSSAPRPLTATPSTKESIDA